MKPNRITVLLLCCLCTAALTLLLDRLFIAPAPAPVPIATQNKTPTFRSGQLPIDFSTAAARVTPAVVLIRAYPSSISRLEPSLRHTTTGSGVVIGSNGLIVTNKHVIEGSIRVLVTLEDKREYEARVRGIDEATDLALLEISASNLPVLAFGDSDSLRIGEWVLAVGNPFSLNSTVTAGIVSGKGRSIDVLEPEDRIESFIQTDAAVNPGNSGGALVNAAGELIGINTAILTNSGRDEGFAFAIPGNLARRVLLDLERYGEVRRAVLGAYVQTLNAAQARQLKLSSARGVLITGLRKRSPALRAGLEVDDVLIQFNGVPIDSPAELQEQLSRYLPGDRVRIRYLRAGRERSVSVLLRDKDNATRRLVSGR